MMTLLALLVLSEQVQVTNTKVSTAIAARCVNAAGTAFEACGGAGGSSWFPDGGAIGSVTVTGTVATGALTDTQLRATPVPVSGTLTCSGPLTDTQIRATPLPVSGSLTCTVASTTITGSVAVTGPLTDTQLRATAVPVSGTVTVGVFPDNEPFNVAQINGVTPLMGTGATGTGSQRVTLATNSPGFSTSGGTIAADSVLSASRAVAYGASPTAIAATTQAPAISDLEGRPYVNIGHPRGVHCTFAAASTATLLELTGCAAVASNSYYITSWRTCGGIANAATVPSLLRSGTGANCGGATVTLDSCWHGTAGCCEVFPGTPIKVTAAHAICGIDATVGTKSFSVQGYIAP